MVSSVRRGNPSRRRPPSPHFEWPKTIRTTVFYGYVYLKDDEQKFFSGSILDLGPSSIIIEMGWKPIFKVIVRMKRT